MMKSRILSTSHSNDDSNVTRIAPLQRVCLQYTDHRLPDESTQAELLKLTGSEGLTLTIRRAANPK
ncbi:hypothetical protein GYMLUDRAFT_94551 [Collybiopsis luxurians FD-317 M1]|nr:hypothetical protein GYMLUDRAFT_94551 [Collybiopsis luxurians FD-317 M1]